MGRNAMCEELHVEDSSESRAGTRSVEEVNIRCHSVSIGAWSIDHDNADTINSFRGYLLETQPRRQASSLTNTHTDI